jgi:hypothetical protein
MGFVAGCIVGGVIGATVGCLTMILCFIAKDKK